MCGVPSEQIKNHCNLEGSRREDKRKECEHSLVPVTDSGHMHVTYCTLEEVIRSCLTYATLYELGPHINNSDKGYYFSVITSREDSII